MGVLVNGVWQDAAYENKSGEFVRSDSVFRDWVRADGSTGFRAEGGRYHLYVSLACPWAHRTLIVRALKGLEDAIGVSIVDPFMGPEGWRFSERRGSIPDTVNGAALLRDIYLKAKPDCTGRVTVPVLWDKHSASIVNNESSEIIRMLNGEFDALATRALPDLYPAALRPQIDHWNDLIYRTVNNGVYRAGFATAQEKYEAAVRELFATLDALEAHLGRTSLPVRRCRHRSGLAPVYHPGAFRRGVLRALQVQPAAPGGLPEPVGVHPRAVPGAGRGRDGRSRADQGALLPQPRAHQSDRGGAAGAGARFHGGAWTRAGIPAGVGTLANDTPVFMPRCLVALTQ